MTVVVNCVESTPVASIQELDTVLDSIQNSCDPRRPVIATIENPHGCRVDIGLGATESLVVVWPEGPSSTADTYYVTVSPQRPAGTMWFWLHGTGDTEFERRHLIPVSDARQIVREFFETGIRSSHVEWEVQHY